MVGQPSDTKDLNPGGLIGDQPTHTTMDPPPRFQLALATYGDQIVVVLVVVGLVLVGAAGYVYTNPETRTVTETTDRQQFATSVETSAIVTGNTSLYEQGEQLSNMPVYLFSATPELTLTVRTTVPSGETVQVAHRLVLVVQAARDGEPFYTQERLLLSNEHQVSEGAVSDSATLDVRNVSRDVSRVREEISGAGSLSAALRLEVDYASELYEGQFRPQATLQMTETSYLLSGQLAASDTQSRTSSRTVTEPPDLGTSAVLALLGLLLVGGAGVVYRTRQHIDVEDLLTERDHARYEEWISQGEFPTDADNRYTSIDSLEDLVDVAIDTDKRVIYDDEFDAYAVVDGNIVYYFATDPESIDPWLDT